MSANLIEMLNATGHWWMIGKGRIAPGEPLFGCLITEQRIHGATLAQTEGADLSDCVVRAIASLSAPSESFPRSGTAEGPTP